MGRDPPYAPTPFTRRLFTFVAVGVAHVALVLSALSTTMTAVASKPKPLMVTLVTATPLAPISVNLAPQALIHSTLPTITPPEVVVAVESAPPATAVTAGTVTAGAPSDAAPIGPLAASVPLPSMSDISYLRQPVPRYPPAARHAREEGLVILRVAIDEYGQVQHVEIFHSSGHVRLDDAAKDAVARAVFKPYEAGGIAHAAIAMIPIEFTLHG